MSFPVTGTSETGRLFFRRRTKRLLLLRNVFDLSPHALPKNNQPVAVVIICIFTMVHPDVLKHLVQGPNTCKENLSALITKVLCVFLQVLNLPMTCSFAQ